MVVSDVIDRLATAGIAAEAMCFTEFPTETRNEAVATLDFLDAHRDDVAVYIVGEFGLTHGSLVAQDPSRFGIRETWALEGDDLGLGIFFAERWKTDDEKADVDAHLADLSTGWTLRTYPWAGAVSTAHTIQYYERFGPTVFKDLAARGVREKIFGARAFEVDMRFDPSRAERAAERDASIWATLVHEERRVGRAAYETHAAAMPALRPSPVRVRFSAGAPPRRVSGRRPSHAVNDATLR